MKHREYGFKENPFSDDSLDYTMRGRDKEWKNTKKILDKFLTEGGSKTLLILGDYGYGKTFMLEKIVQGFNAGDFEKSKKSIVASIRLAESEPEARIGLSFVTKIFYDIGSKNLEKIAKNAKNISKIEISSDMLNIIESLKKEKLNAYEWLSGESLSQSEKNNIGVKKILSKSSQALKILSDFQKVIRAAGFDNLVILLDEFEYIVNVYSEKQVTTILHTFKEIYDEFIRVNTKKPGSMANLIFIIAMTPKGWDVLVETEARLSKKTGGGGITPWMERIRPEDFTVDLRPLGESATNELIKDRIKKKRLDYKKPPYETFPFIHPEFFNVIYKASEGNPRYILRFCDLVLEYALDEEVKEITGKYAQKILKKYPMARQEAGD